MADVKKVFGALSTLARGKPSTVKVPGIGEIAADRIPAIDSAAESYMRRAGRPGEHRIDDYPAHDPELAARIAAEYDRMPHAPRDPEVKRSYDALIQETVDQYKSLKDAGVDIRFLKDGMSDPYAASPSLGYVDLQKNGRLWVFPTERGFGTLNDVSDNPLLKRVGRVGDLENATANDAFRVVHDLYGHFGPGNPFFRAPGEERAWAAHSRMYSPEARGAMTSETRGQNSWVNFGPFGEQNRKASGADTVYADQKAGLMPEWTMRVDGKAKGGLACLARGGQPQIQRAQDNMRDIERRSNGDEIVGDARYRNFLPDFDHLVATRPAGDIDMLRRELPRFASGGDVEGWGGVDPWGGSAGLEAAISQAQSDIASMGGYGGGGDQSGMITDPNDPRAQYNPGDVFAGGFNANNSYNDWAANGGEGPDLTAELAAAAGPASSSRSNLGFDAFSSTPLSSMAVDLSAPKTNYAGAVPDEYFSPEQTMAGPAPTTSSAGMLAGLSSPLGLDFAPQPNEMDREARRGQALGDVEEDAGMPSAISGSMNEKGRGLYDTSVMGALSPQTMGSFFTVEQDPRAARALAREQGITYQQALDIINRPLMETVYNRAAQREISPLNVLNERSQFSGVPGTFGKGQYPGNVQAVTPDPEMVLSAQRINNDIVNGSKAYPSVVDYYNPSVPGLSSWTGVMSRQKDTQTIGQAPYSHVFGNVDRVSVPAYEVAGPTYGAPPARSADLSSFAPDESLGISPVYSSDLAKAPEQEEEGPGYNADFEATPSFLQENFAPDALRGGLGFSPFGYAGGPNFGSALTAMSPMGGVTRDLPEGLPSFLGSDMARQFDPSAFGQTIGSTFASGRAAPSEVPGVTVDGRPIESYGFSGPAAGPSTRQASRPETLAAPVEVSTPRVAESAPEEEDAPAPISTTSTRAVDPLTGKSYNPQTGYSYLAEPKTTARVIDTLLSPVPMLGPINMLGSLLGYSIGNGMAKGVPDARIADAYGNAGEGGGGSPGSTSASAEVPQVSSPAAALGIPVNADWSMRNYLGVSDPRRYGLNPQQKLFAARGGLASLRGR